MKSVCVIFLCLVVAKVHASQCDDLIGTWKNQLNSNMTIESVDGKSFTGHYHTAVESKEGAARFSSKISGMIHPVENGKLIGFNVLWNRGASLTAWVGQCMVCDGKAKIYTTWILRSYLPVKKRWMTTRINQDTFWRVDNLEEQITTTVNQNEVSSEGMLGKWTSVSGNSFDITEVQELGAWKGVHSSEGEIGGQVVGRFDGNQTFTAVGFVGVAANKIKGWTGHIDEPRTSESELETSWLEHTFSPSCSNQRKHVEFGMDDYIKA